MPTYNYRCTKCEKIFDAFHSMMSTDAQHCPECGAVGTKLMSASSVIFKGSGFYSTDYRDSGYLEARKKDGNNGTSARSEAPESTPKADSPAKTESTAAPAKAEPAASSAAKPASPVVQAA